MRREDVIKRVNDRLAALHVPKHVSSVRKIPSYVEVQLLLGEDKRTLRFRSGITPPELEYKLGELEGRWQAWKIERDQVTLEEAIEKAKRHG